MPAFDTPEPITATIHVEYGCARITAADRSDTIVEVRPTCDDNKADVRAAEQTQVEYAAGKLLVKTPKGSALKMGLPGSVDVAVALPHGSRLIGHLEMGDLSCEGSMGACDVRTSAGDIRLDQVGAVQLRTQHGNITVDRAAGACEFTTGSGEVRVREVDGAAEVKNANGNTWIDEITGELRLKVANGNVSVGRAHASVFSKSANGSTRIEEVTRGTVDLQGKFGDLEIGIGEGSATWLDLKSRSGRVYNTLGAADGPGESTETVEVHAATGIGDITIRRAQGSWPEQIRAPHINDRDEA
ncbi:DUF4097 family beta strand repeat-containing protein [Streptomyces alboflavus]|uniref:DUF4097 family beta strand repeat-containing protein n=1 Tax=Streptomyces alboflavus TaxID=67267 RepID=UPI00068AD357|nr:DUF4097 family beta strand repeat-containing protein [Streptomyces alboflavus]